MVVVGGLAAGCASTPNSDVKSPPSSGSSYACEAKQVPGTTVIGKGVFGCHFRLHHPESHRVLADTSYSLHLYAAPERPGEKREPVLSFEGITDAEGRSVYVRAAFPITPDRLYFVEKIGNGPYKRSPRLVRATDDSAIPGMHYKVTWCGAPYVGVSDERGNGAEFRSADPGCKINVQFYMLASELKK